jgi:Mrp family chromosome partitioning ATPase
MARTRDVRSVFAVSSTLGHGKTTTIVNTAIASAISGASVVVVDCDFGNQAASQLLIGEINPRLPGVTDIVDGVSTVDAALHEVTLGNGASLSVIGRGTRPTLAATALQSGRARQLFEELTASFDLVLIDGPPLLQVAYASILAELADGLIVVVEHEGSYSELEDLGARLGLVGTPVLGYVYNRSLLRREMTMSEGSMMDILGDSGMTETPRRVGSSKQR